MPHTPGLRNLLEDPGTGHGSTLAAEKHGGLPASANNPLIGGKGNNVSTNSVPNNPISSTLHSNGDPTNSYSLNGSNQSDVNQGYQQYNDGVPNNLPKPARLDINNMGQNNTVLNGLPVGGAFLPTSNLTSANNGVSPMNNSFVNGTYFASAPPEGLGNF
tara:strand:+ start:17566 stop:18045 length:480 start_codon:yes stop_codon:yes gene_type:complete